MISLDYAIELMEIQRGETNLVTGVFLFSDDIVSYHKELKEMKEGVKNGNSDYNTRSK